jgi:hypothetical protein
VRAEGGERERERESGGGSTGGGAVQREREGEVGEEDEVSFFVFPPFLV